MQLQDIKDFVGTHIKYLDWEFFVGSDQERPYMQIKFSGACARTGDNRAWIGRKWFLSQYMTKSEIVGTAFKAVITAVEHEAREAFSYDGRAIFGPHISVDELWQASKHLDVRHEQ